MTPYLPISRINKIAWNILLAAGILSPPVNPYLIADHLGLRHKKGDLGGISGMLVIKNGVPTIGINQNDSDLRQRFSLAHEIGHYILGHHDENDDVLMDEKFVVLLRGEEAKKGVDPKEIQANAFAAGLLMPEILLRQEVKRILTEGHSLDLSANPDNETFISKLANTFEVSQIAMTYRIGNLQLFEAI